MRTALIALAALACGLPAAAADFIVTVKDTQGRALPDTVVMLRPAAGARPPGPIRFAWPLVMSQQKIAFDPHLLMVPVGSEVSFPNKDTVRHHVYSFSPAKRFELKLFGRDETRRVLFDKPGPVALGCNIHDQMIGYIYVTDTRYTARTGADGVATVRGVPSGGAELMVWRPDLRARTAFTQAVQLGAGRAAVTLPLRPGGR